MADRRTPMSPAGAKAQIGGGLCVLIGALLLFFFARPPQVSLLDLHQMAFVCIGFGVFLIIIGTLARWFYQG